MAQFPAHESDTVEFKESWTDKALKDLAAFANTKGGVVYVGVRDDGAAGWYGCRRSVTVADCQSDRYEIARDCRDISGQTRREARAHHICRARPASH